MHQRHVGGRLAASGVSVVLVGRPRLVQAVAANGLTLTRTEQQPVLVSADKIEVSTDTAALGSCGLVLICVKSRDTAQAAFQARASLPSDVTVVSLQNGVRNAATLRENLPDVRISAGMVPFNVLWTDGPRFHQGTSGAIVVESCAQDLVDLLQSAGVESRTHSDLEGLLWGKLLINLNNAVNALADTPLRQQLADSAYRDLMVLLINEAMAVLKTAGQKPLGLGAMQPWLVPLALGLPDWLFGPVSRAMITIDPEARSSMWEDLNRRRLTEVDWINGEIVALAKSTGGSSPLNAAMVQLVHATEEAGLGSPGLSAQAVREALFRTDG
jgi:2-dehydropantoate 2-reductase